MAEGDLVWVRYRLGSRERWGRWPGVYVNQINRVFSYVRPFDDGVARLFPLEVPTSLIEPFDPMELLADVPTR